MIKTERTSLSLLKPSDYDDLLDLFSEKDAFKYIKTHQNKTQKERINFLDTKTNEIKTGKGFYWVARTKNENHLIGAINLTPIPKTNKIQIGWMIKADYQGKGLAFECSKAVLGFATEKTNFNPIFGIFESGNLASKRILEKLNFKFNKKYKEGSTILFEYIFRNPKLKKVNVASTPQSLI